MKEPSSDASDDAAHQQTSRLTFIYAALAVLAAVITVLGAVVLSGQGEVPTGQPDARQSEGIAEDLIPTAAVPSPPPVTLLPTKPTLGTPRPSSVDGSVGSGGLEETSSPTSFVTIGPLPTATPWPCADEKPVDWIAYRVEQGDTLFSLARRHGTSMDLVVLYNCLESEQIWVGQQLYLPSLPTPNPSAVTTSIPELSPTTTAENLPPTSQPSQTENPTRAATTTATVTARPSPMLTLTPVPLETPTADELPGATATSTSAAAPTSTPVLSETARATPGESATLTPASNPTPTAP